MKYSSIRYKLTFFTTIILLYFSHTAKSFSKDSLIINDIELIIKSNPNVGQLDSLLNEFKQNTHKGFPIFQIGKNLYQYNKFLDAETTLKHLILEQGDHLTITDSIEIEVNHYLGLIYFAIGQHGESIYHQSEVVRLSQARNVKKTEFRAKLHLATSYRNINEMDKAFQYFDEAIANLTEEKDTLNLLWCYYHKGYAYYMEKKIEEAKLNYDLALHMAESYPLVKYMIYNVIGDLYLELDSKKAEDYFLLSINKNTFFDPEQYCHSYIGLGALCMDEDPKKAAMYFEKALNLAEENNFNIHIINSSNKLIQNSIKLGKLENISNYSKNIAEEYKKMYDKKSKESSIIKSRQLISRQNEKLSLLQKDKQISILRNKQRNIIIFLSIGLIIILSIASYIYRKSSISKEQTNKELNDLTIKIEEANNLLNEANSKLKASNLELENFASMAAHDLKAPLRTIHSFSNLLNRNLKNKLNQSDLELMGFILNSTKQMSTLVDDLLLFSKIDKDLPSPKTIDLDNIINGIILRLHSDIKSSGTIINVDKIHNIVAHPSLIQLLLQNIISNAIKFRKPDQVPTIDISTNLINDNTVQIRISDNGIGIKKEYLNKVFDLFRKLNSDAKYKGNGIGLATCKKIVLFYNGKIEVESEYGKGTTFIIQIPSLLETDN